jgi:hypothetical protein
MFKSRSVSARMSCGMRRLPEALSARAIIGDAIFRFVYLVGNDAENFDRNTHHSMMTLTLSQFSTMRLAGSCQRATGWGAPLGSPVGDACAHENHLVRESDLGAKNERWNARDYRGIPTFAMEVEATSPRGFGDRLPSGRIGAGPDAERRTP